MKPITRDIVEKAWAMRMKMVYSMRQIADQLGVCREDLIDAMNNMAERGLIATDDMSILNGVKSSNTSTNK